MEANLVLPYRSFSTASIRNRHKMNTYKYKKIPYPLCSILTKLPANNQNHNAETTTTSCSKNVYKDNWFDRLAINHLSQSIQATTGLRNNKSGYEGLAEAATMVYSNFNSRRQVNIVVDALQRAFPMPILSLMKMVLPQSKWAREYCAAFTTVFFAWLVGPCEVKESEFKGRKENTVVHIKKCRFLEETNCVGMCTNLCKMPSQLFIKDTLGMPVNMVPNFDDMSCEMIFGQDPPQPDTDPAFVQPCYKLCKLSNKHQRDCNSQVKRKDEEIS
ncbi:beta-carotene isomerase D27, chloroplastic [Nicotiana tabacum]|uniref:Beta-carotene isomerase D27, chloroplastic n=2 Tax=Nicotiana TaxID=4085 RepID=A0AC58TRI6_TOBAC|nr:PREDICTED: beta-carotene isomerase D27, chloroplastic isoform X1 [Nicotiana sylvestris]XP_009765815.1 PREDICTED: beta-carotene isomerase D27, chloroplastic isoform X2 [Nicotiana sylvestris]